MGKQAKGETRSKEDILEHVSSLLYPGRSLGDLSYLEGAGGPIRIIPTGVDSERLEARGIDLSKVTVEEANTICSFLDKVKCLDEMVMILASLETGSKRLVMPKDSSRYFESGRSMIRKKVKRKMSGKKSPGRMITLTYDPVKVTRERAWSECGKHISALIDNIKVYLKRQRGITKIQYFWVIEEQQGTGYPHFHVFIQDDSPDHKAGYIPQKRLKRMWGRGGCHITFCSASIRQYITKYIGKVNGMSVLAMALMWKYKRRLYGFSRIYVVVKEGAKVRCYELEGMFHPVKGYGEYSHGSFEWCGAVPVGWLLGKKIENEGSAAHEVLIKRLWGDLY